MGRWVALLRGVNVGGGNTVPMATLCRVAEGLGWGRVASFIASGNLVFDAEGEPGGLAAALRAAMAGGMGVSVPVVVLSGADLAVRVAACPFEPAEGKHVHGFVPFGPARIDAEALAQWKVGSEALVLAGGIVWLHAPEGVGRSKLAEKLHKVVVGPDGPVDVTGRNLNTLRKLVEMTAG